MNRDLVVVNDFYADPDQVREFALRQEYTDFGGKKKFLGRESVYAFPPPGVEARFERLLGAKLHHTESDIFGKFRIASSHEVRSTKIHFDRCDYAANIYLTPGADSSAGLGIYRHVATGLERVPTDDELADLGFEGLDDFDRTVVLRDSLRPECWELIDLVEPVYNSCVILPGSRYFHAAEGGRGVSVDTARLSQHFFVDRVR